ncbi:MAG: hypothetical protein ACPIB3_06195, partial [Luminiphilus sp.]
AQKPSSEPDSREQSRRIGSMKLWRIWAKALGEKASSDSIEADRIALIRTLIVGVNFITCFFIMANTIRHW